MPDIITAKALEVLKRKQKKLSVRSRAAKRADEVIAFAAAATAVSCLIESIEEASNG